MLTGSGAAVVCSESREGGRWGWRAAGGADMGEVRWGAWIDGGGTGGTATGGFGGGELGNVCDAELHVCCGGGGVIAVGVEGLA